MPALNIFKRKKTEEKKEEKKIEQKTEPKKEEQKPERKPRRAKEKRSKPVFHILQSPQITEKATNLAEKNQYVFKIWPKANKPEVKKAIEDQYDVDVVSVRVVKVHPKRRRLGRISGWRKGYKKAIVRIKEGQKIEVMPR